MNFMTLFIFYLPITFGKVIQNLLSKKFNEEKNQGVLRNQAIFR